MEKNIVLNGKKILIIGGTPQHKKLVRAARRLGVYTIVVDYLQDSITKQEADKAYCVSTMDIQGMVDICKKEKVDGVITGYIDPCQRSYQKLCEILNFPCLGTKEQFFKMTDKHAFKKMCMENDVDVIKEYSLEDVEKENIEYPVFVKPVDSRGSRGQRVCYSYEETKKAIKEASNESSNGDVLIEKYMENSHEFQVTYFYINGKPYLIRTVDSYTGTEKNHLEKVVSCAISPSRYTDEYMENAHEKVLKMFENLGIQNGPIFMQGFEDNGTFRFFDPGLRFPGVDYELIYKQVYGIDLMEAMIYFAITGKGMELSMPHNSVYINGNKAAILFPTVKAGTITRIEGYDRVIQDKNIVSLLPRCSEGDKIDWTYNVNQRLAEIDILAENIDELVKSIERVQNTIKVFDENGNDMVFEKFSTSCLNGRRM